VSRSPRPPADRGQSRPNKYFRILINIGMATIFRCVPTISLSLLAAAPQALAQGAVRGSAQAATAAPAPAATAPGAGPDAQQRQQKFLYLLRTYPQRPPDQTLGQVEQLIEQGPFPERDRCLFWLGSARLSLGDRQAARAWFARLAREYPDSVWVQRSFLGLAEASAAEHDFNDSLSWYSRADHSKDAAVRELARIARPNVLTLQKRQHLAWACAAALALGLLGLLAAIARRASTSAVWLSSPSLRSRLQAILRALAPPAEARILLPLLAVLALASLAQDRAPRQATLELCIAGGVLSWLSGAFLRGRLLARAQRLVFALWVLLLLGCGAYLAVWRHDLVGMVLETWRAGPD